MLMHNKINMSERVYMYMHIRLGKCRCSFNPKRATDGNNCEENQVLWKQHLGKSLDSTLGTFTPHSEWCGEEKEKKKRMNRRLRRSIC